MKRFVDILGTQSVYIRYEVGFYCILSGLCMVSATKKRQGDYTTFAITVSDDGSTEATTISVMSLFATRTIKKLRMNLYETQNSVLFNAFMKCNLNIESFEELAIDNLPEEHLQQPIFATLQQLGIDNSAFNCNFMKQVNTYIPNLAHLTLVDCTSWGNVLLPSIQLTSLSLTSSGFNNDLKKYTRLLFKLYTTKCSEQMFIAAPNMPLQRVTKEDVRLLGRSAFHIECGSLKHLSVNIGDFKFEMTFDDDTNLIKSVDRGIEDSYYSRLQRKTKILEKRYKEMTTRVKVAEKKYSKSKKYLNASQIQAIEDSVAPQI